MKNAMDEQGGIPLFTSEDGQVQLSVLLDEETVWLTQAQMAILFGSTPENIIQHLQNIYLSEELDKNPTTKNFLVVRQEGRRQVRRSIKHYNLDAIISVGYRVSSRRATQFRQWATRTLKQHLVEGYTLNQHHLAERGIAHEQVVSLLAQTLTRQSLVSDKGAAVIAVVQEYARSWSLLQGYDEESLSENKHTQQGMQPLTLTEAEASIAALKATLTAKVEVGALFGQPRNDGLASVLANIEQGFGDVLYYPNVASRAAHLRYFIIKNHLFIYGNKHIGSFLFLCYLHRNQYLLAKTVEALINNNTFVALALLFAESKPAQKTLLIRLIEHFISPKEGAA